MKGCGSLNLTQQADAVALLRGGMKQHQVAARFGVTKNTIAGVWARAGEGVPVGGRIPTLFDRCDALAAKMDRVLAETPITYVMQAPKVEKEGRR